MLCKISIWIRYIYLLFMINVVSVPVVEALLCYAPGYYYYCSYSCCGTSSCCYAYYYYYNTSYYSAAVVWSIGAIVGAVIGGIIGLVVLAVIIICIVQACKSTSSKGTVVRPANTNAQPAVAVISTQPAYGYSQPQPQPYTGVPMYSPPQPQPQFGDPAYPPPAYQPQMPNAPNLYESAASSATKTNA